MRRFLSAKQRRLAARAWVKGTRHSLRTRVLIFAILFGLVPLLISSSLNYSNADRALREGVFRNLDSLASAKAARIESYLHGVHQKVELLAGQPELAARLVGSRSGEGLRGWAERAGALDVVLVDRNGNVVEASRSRGWEGRKLGGQIERATPPGRAFEQALAQMGASNSGFYLEPSYTEPVMLVSAPVRSGGRLAGVLIVVEGNEEFAAVVNDPTGLGATGETLVAVRSVNELALVAPPRLKPEAWFTLRVAMGSEKMKPLQEAARGASGIAEMTDYRQVGTLAAWRYLPSMDGGLVVKMDNSEALETVYQQRTFFFTLMGLAGSMMLLGGYLVAATIAKPVTKLTTAVEELKENLKDPAYQLPSLTGPDEIGLLARAFTGMAGELRASFRAQDEANRTLETRVAAGTADLRKAKEEIERLLDEAQDENQRLGAELQVTRRLQRILLPDDQELAYLKDLDISALMEPASEVGGDFYDVIESDGRVLVAIGDVTGHGLESGVISIMTQTALRTLVASGERDAKRMLQILNTVLGENARRMKCDRNLTFTLLEFADGRAKITGQHEEILIARAGGGLERHDTLDLGFNLGLVPDVTPFTATETVELQRGDVTALYTDGLTEAENEAGERYGVERLCACLDKNRGVSAAEMMQAVLWDWEGHVGSQAIADDVTLLVVRSLKGVEAGSGLERLARGVEEQAEVEERK